MKKTKLKFRKARTLIVREQTATQGVNILADSKRTAMKAGLRISKTGNFYWETRANRSDKDPKSKL